MLHNILPTNSRLHRLKQKDSPACTLCSAGTTKDCLHALLVCSHNSEVNKWVLGIIRSVVPTCTLEDITKFNFELSQDIKFPLIWILSYTFSLVWQLRLDKKSVPLYIIRASLEARIISLRKSRLFATVSKIQSLIDL